MRPHVIAVTALYLFLVTISCNKNPHCTWKDATVLSLIQSASGFLASATILWLVHFFRTVTEHMAILTVATMQFGTWLFFGIIRIATKRH